LETRPSRFMIVSFCTYAVKEFTACAKIKAEIEVVGRL
jgi:hypothetical protein